LKEIYNKAFMFCRSECTKSKDRCQQERGTKGYQGGS